ncbi:MAG TPA: MBL fold metallo-hydrolase [Myxococcota bacterium]
MLIRQLFEPESCTYTYLVADEAARECVLIDPVREMVDRDLEQVLGLGLTLVATLETHVHADHITGASLLKDKTRCRTVLSRASGVACADQLVDDGETFRVGAVSLSVRATPGHTSACVTYVVDGAAFTGDALLIRGCGRTDFQDGDARALFRSVREKILALPATTLLYPAHDYRGRSLTTVAEEKKSNPRLHDGVDEDAFAQIMARLKLAPPKKIAVAVPANMRCGQTVDTPLLAWTGFEGGEGI